MSREVLKKRIHQHFDRKKIKDEQLETLLVRSILSLKKEKGQHGRRMIVGRHP